MTTKMIPLDKIRLDGNTQSRADEPEGWLIDEYAQLYIDKVQLPPVEVMSDGTSYWLWDGFHRRWAAERAGLDRLPCHVEKGTQQDAQWASYSANQWHGLRRSNADKEHAVKRALRHPDGASLSDVQLGQHVGVSPTTIAKYRAELESTSQIERLETRVGRDGKKRKKPKRRRRNNVPEVRWCTVCHEVSLRPDQDRCQYCIDTGRTVDGAPVAKTAQLVAAADVLVAESAPHLTIDPVAQQPTPVVAPVAPVAEPVAETSAPAPVSPPVDSSTLLELLQGSLNPFDIVRKVWEISPRAVRVGIADFVVRRVRAENL